MRQFKIAVAVTLVSMMSAVSASAGDVASYYGKGFHGRMTASGERFNQHAMTCAHRSRAFGTRLRVTFQGRSAVCRVNDRGPFIRGRTLDVSVAVANAIGLTARGVGAVTVEVL